MTALQAAGHEAVGLSRARGRGLHWNPDQGELDPVAGFEAVVNLCGATIGGRFTDRRKALIREGRGEGADLLARGVAFSYRRCAGLGKEPPPPLGTPVFES